MSMWMSDFKCVRVIKCVLWLPLIWLSDERIIRAIDEIPHVFLACVFVPCKLLLGSLWSDTCDAVCVFVRLFFACVFLSAQITQRALKHQKRRRASIKWPLVRNLSFAFIIFHLLLYICVYIHTFEGGSYDAILKIIIWCNRIWWHALMLEKHIIFQILYIIEVPLCPASLT